MKIRWKLEFMNRKQNFNAKFCFLIWPSDIVFESRWPLFTFVKEIMQISILTKFHENWMKTLEFMKGKQNFNAKLLTIDLLT